MEVNKELVIEKIKALWEKYPELRFGQLIVNAFHSVDELYFFSDDKFIEHIEMFYKNIEESKISVSDIKPD